MYSGEYRVMFEVEDKYWWYRGLRVLLHLLLEHYPPQPNGMILDVGCGTGANLMVLANYGHAIGVDISEKALAFTNMRGIPKQSLYVASATALPFLPATFDLVTSFDVICNIPDDLQAFSEIARVLKPGGRTIIQLPAYQRLYGEHDVAVGALRRYDKRVLSGKLNSVGLKIERLMHTNCIMMPIVACVRLINRPALIDGSSARSDLQIHLPRPINSVLSAYYRAEMRLAARVNLPFGLSVVAVAKKSGPP
jgi:SAM-dependent methyltransferase